MTLKSSPKSEELSIYSLFTSDYVVPTFQREYSWKAENVESLIDDVGSLVDNPDDFYYLGQIVVTEEVSVGDRKRSHIVDGQQRLVTLQLLFIYLLKRLKRMNSEYVSEMSHMLRRLPKIVDDPISMRVLLSEGSDRLLQNMVELVPPPVSSAESLSEKNLLVAYDQIKESLDGKDDEYIESFRMVLTHQTIISRLKIGSLGEALEIFEVLNQRGLDLNDSDLIKNYLFSQIPDDLYEKISKVWNSISKKVFGLKPARFASLNLLLRSELTARTGLKISNSELLSGWKTYLSGGRRQDGSEPGAQTPKSFMRDLEQISHAYSNFTVFKKPNDTLFKSGSGLGHFNAIQHVPILLAGRKLKNIEVLMELVESRFLLSIFANEGPQNFEKIIPSWANDVYRLANSNPNASESEILASSARAFTGETELWKTFETRFNSLQYTKDSKKIRFALARVLSKLEHDCHGEIEYQGLIKGTKYHLDHIEPKTSQRKGEFQVGSLNLIDSVGNLVIIKGKSNSSMSNMAPENKTSHYLATGWVMHMMLCREIGVNIPEANRRRKFLAVQELADLSLSNWTKKSVIDRNYFCMNYFASTFTHLKPPNFVVPEQPTTTN